MSNEENKSAGLEISPAQPANNDSAEQSQDNTSVDNGGQAPEQVVDAAGTGEGAPVASLEPGDTVIQREGAFAIENAAGELKPILDTSEKPAEDQTKPADAEGTPSQDPAPIEQAKPEPVPEPVQSSAPAPAVAPVTVNVPVDVAAEAATINQVGVLNGALPIGASSAAKLAVAELEDYLRESTYALTRRITDDRGAAMQAGLYRALKGAVNVPAADFEVVMNIFLATIHANKDGVFHPTKVLHHMPHLNIPSAGITSFKKLVNMFTSMADPAGRAATKRQINFPSTLDHRDIREDSRQRVLEFFNV